jgi:hypothetical protein
MAGVGPTGRRPVPPGEAVAAVSGILLFVFLFLPWFGAGSAVGGSGSDSASGWEIYTLADLVLTVLGLGTAALAAAGFAGAGVRLPVPRNRLIKWFAVIALTIVLTTVIELSTGDPGKLFNLKIGGILAALAAIGMLAGAILSERPELAARLASVGQSGGGAPTEQMPPAGGYGAPPAGGYAAPPQQQAAPPVQQQAPPPAAAPQATSVGQVQPPPQPAAPPPPAGGAADWYPDPTGQKRLRYWDGSQWTDHTAD